MKLTPYLVADGLEARLSDQLPEMGDAKGHAKLWVAIISGRARDACGIARDRSSGTSPFRKSREVEQGQEFFMTTHVDAVAGLIALDGEWVREMVLRMARAIETPAAREFVEMMEGMK